MKKIILAVLIFIPSLMLSSCYVTQTPNDYYHVGYYPSWDRNYYQLNDGWYRHSSWRNNTWGYNRGYWGYRGANWGNRGGHWRHAGANWRHGSAHWHRTGHWGHARHRR